MSTINHGEDAADARHNTAPSVGAMDRNKDLPYLDPKFNPSKPISVAVSAPTQPAVPPVAAPSPFLIPVPAETMRAAIKDAALKLHAIDSEADSGTIRGGLREVITALIEAL